MDLELWLWVPPPPPAADSLDGVEEEDGLGFFLAIFLSGWGKRGLRVGGSWDRGCFGYEQRTTLEMNRVKEVLTIWLFVKELRAWRLLGTGKCFRNGRSSADFSVIILTRPPISSLHLRVFFH